MISNINKFVVDGKLIFCPLVNDTAPSAHINKQTLLTN